MPKLPSRPLTPIFATALLLAAAAPALAQQDRYQELVREAVEEFARGNFTEARSFFSQAHAIEPNARTLRGLGMVAYELRHYVEAVRHLRAALGSPARPLEGGLREQTGQLLAKAEALVGSVQLQLSPASARLRVDGRAAELEADGSLLLSVGEHKLAVSAEGHQGQTLSLDVRSGQRETLQVALPPLGSATSPEAAAATVSPDAGDPPLTGASARDDDDSVLESWWFWTAAAVVVGGGILAAVLVSQEDDVEPQLEGDRGLQTRALVLAP